MDSSKIVIVCALKEEFAAVEEGLGEGHRERFEVLRSGVGPASATRTALELAARAQPPTLVISTGFCGGLIDALEVGDVVVGCEIVHVRAKKKSRPPAAGTSENEDEISRSITRRIQGTTLDQKVADTLQQSQLRARLGRMASVEEPVLTCDAKGKLGKRYGAHAVDMESHALCANLKCSVLFVRAISDSARDELPAEVGEFLDENGGIRLGKLTRFVLKNPANIKRLLELKKRAEVAAKSLREAWRALRDFRFNL